MNFLKSLLSRTKNPPPRLEEPIIIRINQLNELYGRNLDDWLFLGTTVLRNRTSDGQFTAEGMIVFFIRKDDMTTRSASLLILRGDKADIEHHPWYNSYGQQWFSGQVKFYKHIATPSDALIDYMENNLALTWKDETMDWVPYKIAKVEDNIIYPNKAVFTANTHPSNKN